MFFQAVKLNLSNLLLTTFISFNHFTYGLLIHSKLILQLVLYFVTNCNNSENPNSLQLADIFSIATTTEVMDTV